MTKSAHSTTPQKAIAKNYYGLEEAEKMLGLSGGTLIQMGARSGLPIYVMPDNWEVRYRSRTIVHGERIDPPTEGSWPDAQPALTDRLTTPVRLYQETLARCEFDTTATTRNFFNDNKYQEYFQPETGKHVHVWDGASTESKPSQQISVTEEADAEQWTPDSEVSREIYEFEVPLSSLPTGATGITVASCALVIMAEDLHAIHEKSVPLPTIPIGVAEQKPAVTKAPNTFVSALIQLLVEISRRAAIAEPPISFSTQEMPGQRIDLQELAGKIDVDLKHPPNTFNTYIKGLINFKSGAQRTEFYQNLFPELFK